MIGPRSPWQCYNQNHLHDNVWTQTVLLASSSDHQIHWKWNIKNPHNNKMITWKMRARPIGRSTRRRTDRTSGLDCPRTHGRIVRATLADGPRQTRGDFQTLKCSKSSIPKLEQDIHGCENKILHWVHDDNHNQFHQTIWWIIYPKTYQRPIYRNPKIHNIWTNFMENLNTENKTLLMIIKNTLRQSTLESEPSATQKTNFLNEWRECVRRYRMNGCFLPQLTKRSLADGLR
jgi:hypothetical protein